MSEFYSPNKNSHSVSSHFERLFLWAFFGSVGTQKFLFPLKNIFIIARLADMLCNRTPDFPNEKIRGQSKRKGRALGS